MSEIYKASPGNLLKCRLVHTINSKKSNMPLIGIVIENLYSEGQNLLVPAETEFFGEVAGSKRNRLMTQNRFTLICKMADKSIWTQLIRGLILEKEHIAGLPGRVCKVPGQESFVLVPAGTNFYLSVMEASVPQILKTSIDNKNNNG